MIQHDYLIFIVFSTSVQNINSSYFYGHLMTALESIRISSSISRMTDISEYHIEVDCMIVMNNVMYISLIP